jgi:hypothetical protein
MRLFQRPQPPERHDSASPPDPEIQAAKDAYQQDKQAMIEKRAELLARVRRLQYERGLATRRAERD